MSIWKKLAAATAEISPETAISALFGGGAAHRASNPDRRREDWPTDEALPFTVGMISLGAKMAKSDGVVTKDEVRAFKKAFNVSDEEMKQAARAFKLARQDTTGHQTCSEQLFTAFRGDRKLLEYVLEGLFHIAKADEMIHSQEEKFLAQVAKCFGFTDADFALMKARHRVAGERNPYDVLGLKPSASDDELESQYRWLLSESQSDEFVGRGMPQEFALIATAKRAAITEAYEAITKERRLG